MTSMNMIPIANTSDLEALCKDLASAEFLAVDTEFMREQTYYPNLCLIQVAGPGSAATIDPMSPELDLKPFWDLMALPEQVKVFHAARQDLEIFHIQGGFIPRPVFDTQVAAMVCGFGDQVSYVNLARRLGCGNRQVFPVHGLVEAAIIREATQVCPRRCNPSARRLPAAIWSTERDRPGIVAR